MLQGLQGCTASHCGRVPTSKVWDGHLKGSCLASHQSPMTTLPLPPNRFTAVPQQHHPSHTTEGGGGEPNQPTHPQLLWTIPRQTPGT